MIPTFTVFGNAGSLTVNAIDGTVISYEPQEDGRYRDIQRFDVAEWRRTYVGESITGTSVDILDIGFWQDGEYFEPEEDWRKTRSL